MSKDDVKFLFNDANERSGGKLSKCCPMVEEFYDILNSTDDEDSSILIPIAALLTSQHIKSRHSEFEPFLNQTAKSPAAQARMDQIKAARNETRES